ncbi:serine hydrolase [Cucumibacter marinus]|uniref:serine hydrolase n=1 Tax=Cucumibacter marinus TaxID=1121252 RepID=UPI000685EE05|nr:serine hydrolase [Cucumibacter marinus]
MTRLPNTTLGRIVTFLMALGAASLMVSPSLAQPANPEKEVIEELLTAGEAEANQFAPSFLQMVPVSEVNTLLSQLHNDIGEPTGIEGSDGRYVVTTPSHEMVVEIVLDQEGRIAGLLFRAPVETGGEFTAQADKLLAFGEQVHLLVTRNGEVIHEHGANTELAVGSAFKLGVLQALTDKIEAGEHDWDEVITLTETDRSLPSGILQAYPAGSPLTIHTAASLMISQSDNTATDLLMRVVGQEPVEAALGGQVTMRTQDLFKLKAEDDLRKRFAEGSDAEKRAVLAELQDLPLPAARDVGAPHEKGVEWYLSAYQLCGLIEDVRDLDLFAINPGVADANDWAKIAFKGGSETGVLNLTTWLENEDGDGFCVAYTVNDPEAIDENDAITAYGSLLGQLARDDSAN